MNINMNIDANSRNMTNIIALSVHDTWAVWTKAMFLLKKNRITTAKEIKRVFENLKITGKKKEKCTEEIKYAREFFHPSSYTAG